MSHTAQAPIELVIAVLALCAGVIGVAGTRITHVSDRLADATGWGEAFFGAVFLGASTSLPGIVTSVAAAWGGHAELAFSNALGGIAAQTLFLAIADMAYRNVNLEHAAASVSNMMQGSLLLVLLTAVLVVMHAPVLEVAHVHPGSVVLGVAYVLGSRMILRSRDGAAWRAVQTPETVLDKPDQRAALTRRELTSLWVQFGVLAAIVVAAGYCVAVTGVAVAARTGLSETVVGGIFTAVVTSLPELVTSVAAVRRGALTLAVGDIIGGNTFDVLFVATADVTYFDGSIYHALGDRQSFMVAMAALLNGVLLLGLLRREKRGIGNIGFESVLILLLYAGGTAVLFQP